MQARQPARLGDLDRIAEYNALNVYAKVAVRSLAVPVSWLVWLGRRDTGSWVNDLGGAVAEGQAASPAEIVVSVGGEERCPLTLLK